jgi:hypothetical protein
VRKASSKEGEARLDLGRKKVVVRGKFAVM